MAISSRSTSSQVDVDAVDAVMPEAEARLTTFELVSVTAAAERGRRQGRLRGDRRRSEQKQREDRRDRREASREDSTHGEQHLREVGC
jgi:hypothetical protein